MTSDTDHTTNAVVAIDRAIAQGEAHLAKLRKARETLAGDASPVVRNKPGRKPKDTKNDALHTSVYGSTPHTLHATPDEAAE